MYDASQLPALVAVHKKRRSGLVTYRMAEKECEIVTLNSLVENVGIGTALLDAVTGLARLERCTRVWLITTNDNTNALHFYQRRGFRIADIHIGAIEESRKLKAEIPLVGYNGIPILDEIELEKTIGA
jgi:GNAT superfamily N-acetyltransferase